MGLVFMALLGSVGGILFVGGILGISWDRRDIN